MDPKFLLQALETAPGLNEKQAQIAADFAKQYLQVVADAGLDIYHYADLFAEWLKTVQEQLETPYAFPCHHTAVREPFDFYQFGKDFFHPLIDVEHSKVFGQPSIQQIEKYLEQGENVFLLSNHQAEADPQILNYLLDRDYPSLMPKATHIAGERVLTDPFAIPMSLGLNLLCIYSKKYLEHPPERSLEKKQHNQQALVKLGELLKEGGHCFWVAPSGGRDRPDQTGEFAVSPLDPKSIEMFRLLARKAKTPTHFFPLSLLTYPILPPPDAVQLELGEKRTTSRHPVFLYFGDEINFSQIEPLEPMPKSSKQKKVADTLWQELNKNYQFLLQQKRSFE